MNARLLSVEEWNRLEGLPMEVISRTTAPGDSGVVVVEDQGRIVATMTVLRIVHFESLWIDPEYRGRPSIVGRLWALAVDKAKSWRARWVWGASDSQRMTSIIERLGGEPLKVTSFVIPIGD